MMSIGRALQNILGLGGEDPRAMALAAAQGQPAGGVAPRPAAGGTGATPTAGGSAQPPPAPGMAGTPPDLAAMYERLVNKERQASGIDRGLTTMAAGFAKPENRQALLAMAGGYGSGGGSGGTGGPQDILKTLMGIHNMQAEQQQQGVMRARLPAIARSYNIPLHIVEQLHDAGKLQDTLDKLAVPDTQVVDRPDGSKQVIDMRTAEQVGQDVAPMDLNPTSDLKELAAINWERTANGEPRMSTEEYLSERDARRAPQTNIVNQEESEFNKGMGRQMAERYDGITKGANNAAEMMGMYDLVEAALNASPDMYTGFGGEQITDLKRFGAMLGLDVDKGGLGAAETIRSIQNRMALVMRNPDSGMGMPGAVSDRDIQFLKDAQVGLARTEGGNRAMIKAFRGLEQRKIEIAELADDYLAENGKLDAGFNRAVREWAQANPLFNEDDFKAPDAEGGPPAVTSVEAWEALPDGAQYIDPTGQLRTKMGVPTQ